MRIVALLMGCYLVSDAFLLAQGCSMCKASLQGQADTIVNSIKLGIVVMLLPAITIVVGILLALRQSSRMDREQPAATPGSSPIHPDAG